LGFDHRPKLAVSWLWWAFWLLPLDRARAASFHEAIKQHFLARQQNGSAFVQPIPGANVDDPAVTLRALTLAYQLGDMDTAAALRSHVEATYEPIWNRQTGEFHYGFRLDEPIPRGQFNSHIFLSEIGEPGGWHRLFNESSARRFEEPTVCGIDYPNVELSEAHYDAGKRTLFLHLHAGEPSAIGRPTRFRVQNLQRPGNCRVVTDGVANDKVQARDGELEIEATINECLIQITQE
jgi:hypothetical protein